MTVTSPTAYCEPLWASGRRYRNITGTETALLAEQFGPGPPPAPPGVEGPWLLPARALVQGGARRGPGYAGPSRVEEDAGREGI